VALYQLSYTPLLDAKHIVLVCRSKG